MFSDSARCCKILKFPCALIVERSSGIGSDHWHVFQANRRRISESPWGCTQMVANTSHTAHRSVGTSVRLYSESPSPYCYNKIKSDLERTNSRSI